jgi:hypothetical protein
MLFQHGSVTTDMLPTYPNIHRTNGPPPGKPDLRPFQATIDIPLVSNEPWFTNPLPRHDIHRKDHGTLPPSSPPYIQSHPYNHWQPFFPGAPTWNSGFTPGSPPVTPRYNMQSSPTLSPISQNPFTQPTLPPTSTTMSLPPPPKRQPTGPSSIHHPPPRQAPR